MHNLDLFIIVFLCSSQLAQLKRCSVFIEEDLRNYKYGALLALDRESLGYDDIVLINAFFIQERKDT
ncbi:MAG: hypothetical protein ACJAXN_002931 [Psychromonas sp.]|jgi:hypothetical protein